MEVLMDELEAELGSEKAANSGISEALRAKITTAVKPLLETPALLKAGAAQFPLKAC